MKKIFSILLTIALLAGMLLPMGVSAAAPDAVISATGTTVIELETYRADFVMPDAWTAPSMWAKYKDSPNASGNYTLLFWSNWSTSATADLTIPVDVAEAGTYTMTVVGSTTCPLTLIVDGETYEPFASYNLDATDATAENTTHNNTDYPGKEYMFNVDLDTDTTDITVNLHKHPTSNQIATGLDCIRIRNAKVAINSKGAETTIQVEDYAAAKYIGTDASNGFRDGSGTATTEVTTGGAVAFGGAKRAFMVNKVSSNMYPYNLPANRIMFNMTVGSDNYSGVKLQKWDRENKAWSVHTLTQEERNAYTDYDQVPQNNPAFDGYMAVKIPVDVQASGTYQLDILCLDPSFGNNYIASPIEIYRGEKVDPSNPSNQIGIVKHSNTNKVLMDTAKDANGAFPYMYRNASIKGFTDAPIARFTFSAQLSPADKYITLAIKTRAKYSPGGETLLASVSHEITQYIDSVTITGANAATSEISKSTRKGSVVYGPAERAIGKAILALYNDDQLVAVEKWDAKMGEAIMEFSTTYSGPFNAAKVFIWEDFENCLPKVVAKPLEVLD